MFTSALEWIQKPKWCSSSYRKNDTDPFQHWKRCRLKCGKRLIYLLLVLSWTCSQTQLTLSILLFQVDPNEMTHQMYRIILCKCHLFFGYAFAVSKHKDTWICQTTLWERLAHANTAQCVLQVLLNHSLSHHSSISSFESCCKNVVHHFVSFHSVLAQASHRWTLCDVLMLFKHCK